MADDAKRAHRVEVLATVLLAVSALSTAWSTYQSAQWRGQQASHTAKSTAARIESSEATIRAGQLTQVDVATFTEWVDADVAGNTELADFYRERFRDEFVPAFTAWAATDPQTNPDAPETPFQMPEYRLADAEQAAQLNAEASSQAAEAAAAMQRADDYMLAVVLFAVALFFAGVSTKLESLGQRTALLALGGLIFAGTAIWIVTLSVRS